jgi:hypothetical protein
MKLSKSFQLPNLARIIFIIVLEELDMMGNVTRIVEGQPYERL